MSNFAMWMTEEEQILVDFHLNRWLALDRGVIVPKTQEDRHFFDVCRGKERASTKEEIAYLKYCYNESQASEEYDDFLSNHVPSTRQTPQRRVERTENARETKPRPRLDQFGPRATSPFD